MTRTRASLPLLMAILLAAGCTSKYQVRGTEQRLKPIPIDHLAGTSREAIARQINIEGRSVEDFVEARIGIVEFDEDGNTNPAQVQAVMQMVREELDAPALMVTFVHGWHHGARVCDRDLACFRRVLQQLKILNPHRNVVGIYVGWRGESCTVPVVNLGTIWRRKQVAEHIGRTGLVEVLLQLQEHYRHARDRGLDTTMVSLGHSLGGAMLYSAVKGKLSGNVADIERRGRYGSYRIVRAHGDREEALKQERKALRAGFGDLVVLVNPAIEAREYGAFAADLPDKRKPATTEALIDGKHPYDSHHPYDPKQLPVLMAVASTADTAVGRIFPIAQWVSAVPMARLYQFQPAGWHAIGRYESQLTHTLSHPVVDAMDEFRDDCDCTKRWRTGELAREVGGLDLRARGLQRFGSLEFDLAPHRRDNWDPGTPYLVVSASPGVIREHSDIFNPVFIGFITRYIRAIELARHQSEKQGR